MIFEALQIIFAVIFFTVSVFVLIESSRSISEKKKRQRMGLTDYYDRPIEKKKEE
jgi:hypothetical protein